MDFLRERKGWAALIICLILIFAVFKKNKSRERNPPLAAPHAAHMPNEPKQAIIDKSEVAPSPSRAGSEIRRQYNAMMMTGMREIPTVSSSSTLLMKLRPAPTPIRCSLGEYDLLKGMVNKLNQQLFLVTI